MRYLKQSTASQTRTIGPFVDDTDFKTLENGLTIANTDILLKKNGGASAAKNSGGATADGSGGMYHLTFDATDSATVGELFYSVKVAGALVVFGSFTVLEEAVYDALYAASATGKLPATLATADVSGNLPANVVSSAGHPLMVAGVVDDTNLSPTTTQFDTDILIDGDPTGRRLVFASGSSLEYEACTVQAYSIVSGKGRFTVSELSAAPANTDAVVLV
jgi:hypothetical protein